jgi:hypothetical protein
MPLILISGYPSSGKTHRSHQLITSLRALIACSAHPSHARLSVVHINDQTLSIPREAYREAKTEKQARAEFSSAIKRALGKDAIVVADGLGYIKGWRYQMYCEAKAAGTTCCVVSMPATSFPHRVKGGDGWRARSASWLKGRVGEARELGAMSRERREERKLINPPVGPHRYSARYMPIHQHAPPRLSSLHGGLRRPIRHHRRRLRRRPLREPRLSLRRAKRHGALGQPAVYGAVRRRGAASGADLGSAGGERRAGESGAAEFEHGVGMLSPERNKKVLFFHGVTLAVG